MIAVALDAIRALPLTPNPEHADLSVAAINQIHFKEVCAQVIDDTEQGARINAHIRSGAGVNRGGSVQLESIVSACHVLIQWAQLLVVRNPS